MKQWWHWRRRDEELEKEMQHHLRMAVTERLERGASPPQARAEARREFGNAALVKELARDAWGWRWLRDLFEDLRYGYRTLTKSLGFSIIAISTLALGIGANTAIFSLVDAALLRAIPVRDADQLVLVQWKAKNGPNHLSQSSYGDCELASANTGASGCSLSEPFFREITKRDNIFSSVAAFAAGPRLNLSGSGAATIVDRAEYISGAYFEALRIKPALGRLIANEDDATAAGAVVVLSFHYWRSQFGGSQDVLGKTILLNRVPFAIVGVAEEPFDSLSPGNKFDMWIPLAMASRLEAPWDNRDINPSYWRLVMIGRLRPEVASTKASAELSALFQNETTHGRGGLPVFKPEDGAAINLLPLEQGLTGSRGDAATPLYVLMLVVGIVLLIACANVAGLALARETSRRREMAVRFALGASNSRILRQLLTESLMLSCAGGVVGALMATWCVAAIQNFLQSTIDGPLPFTATLDGRVLLFTAATTVLTGILFGLAPALRGLRVDLGPGLKDGAGSSQTSRPKRGWFSAGNSLVIAQVALSIVVLAGAGLLVRTLQNLKNIYPGFDARNVLTFSLDPSLIGYKAADSNNLYRDLQQRLARTPGIASVSYSWGALLGGNLWTTTFHMEGRPKDDQVAADVLPVGPQFFQTMRIALLAGREFNAEDFAIAQRLEAAQEQRRVDAAAKLKAGTGASTAASKVPKGDLPPTPAIVNQTFVRKYFPAANPVGRIFGSQEGDPGKGEDQSAGWQIAGVVSDAKYNNLRRDIAPTIYIPSTGGPIAFSVRTEADPLKFVSQVHAVVAQMDGNLPMFSIKTETQRIDERIFKERLVARLCGSFGTLALLLACIGLYGLVSYEVARRTREIGIRSALGAARRDVLRLVLAEGMRLALAGTVVGVALAFILTRFAKDLLFGVQAADPLTFLLVTLLLFSVTLLACLVPARRATRVDPVVALRYE